LARCGERGFRHRFDRADELVAISGRTETVAGDLGIS